MPRPNRKDDVRRAAAQLFREQGFSATSMDDVSMAVGLNKGSLYHYYSSKADLLVDVVLAPETALANRMEEISPEDDPVSQLRSMIAIIADVSETWPNEVAVGFAERAWMHRSLNEKQLAVVTGPHQRMLDRVAAMVHAGQDLGVFNSEIDHLVVLHTFTGLAGFYTHSTAGLVTERQVITDSYLTLLLTGLTRPSHVAD